MLHSVSGASIIDPHVDPSSMLVHVPGRCTAQMYLYIRIKVGVFGEMNSTFLKTLDICCV
jgi:hypothetical protein